MAIARLNGVSLSCTCGEVATVIGPSGGGKSTLLRCINGLETFQAGEVQVDNVTLEAGTGHRKLSSTLHALRRRVGMVFQQFHLFPHMTVLENVLAGPLYVLDRNRDEAEPEAPPVARARWPCSISHGDARAIIGRPAAAGGDCPACNATRGNSVR